MPRSICYPTSVRSCAASSLKRICARPVVFAVSRCQSTSSSSCPTEGQTTSKPPTPDARPDYGHEDIVTLAADLWATMPKEQSSPPARQPVAADAAPAAPRIPPATEAPEPEKHHILSRGSDDHQEQHPAIETKQATPPAEESAPSKTRHAAPSEHQRVGDVQSPAPTDAKAFRTTPVSKTPKMRKLFVDSPEIDAFSKIRQPSLSREDIRKNPPENTQQTRNRSTRRSFKTPTASMPDHSPTWVHMASLPSSCTKSDVIKAIAAAGPVGRVMGMTFSPPDPSHADHAVASVEFNTMDEARRLLRQSQFGSFSVNGCVPFLRMQAKDPGLPSGPLDGPQFRGYPPSRVLFVRGKTRDPMMREHAIRKLLVDHHVDVESERVQFDHKDEDSMIMWYFCSWRHQARKAMFVLRANTTLGVWYGLDPCEFGYDGLEARILRIKEMQSAESDKHQHTTGH